MWNLPDHSARDRAQSHGEYKASVYRATSADLFIESSATQAIEIADLSGKPVFSMASGEMIVPDRAGTMLSDALNQAAAAPNPALRAASLDHWTSQVQSAVNGFLRIVPPGSTAILIDEWQWGMARTFAGRKIVHFVERDGQYWGAPTDDAMAIAEFELARETSRASFVIVGFPAFWWRTSYPAFFRHLNDRYATAVEDSHMVVYDLRVAATHRRVGESSLA
jgi:hypothetical protein